MRREASERREKRGRQRACLLSLMCGCALLQDSHPERASESTHRTMRQDNIMTSLADMLLHSSSTHITCRLREHTPHVFHHPDKRGKSTRVTCMFPLSPPSPSELFLLSASMFRVGIRPFMPAHARLPMRIQRLVCRAAASACAVTQALRYQPTYLSSPLSP